MPYELWIDPGHSWLRVHWTEVNQAGVLTKITPYSYYDRPFVYLEEDIDMTTFVDAVRGELTFSEWWQQNGKDVHKSARDFGHYYVPDHAWNNETKAWENDLLRPV